MTGGGREKLWIVIAIPEIPISGFPEIPFFNKSRNSGIFQAKIPEIRDFHFFALLDEDSNVFSMPPVAEIRKIIKELVQRLPASNDTGTQLTPVGDSGEVSKR